MLLTVSGSTEGVSVGVVELLSFFQIHHCSETDSGWEEYKDGKVDYKNFWICVY